MADAISFDRAVEYYDRTRALGAEAMGATVELLTAEIQEPALEIGVGTGLISLPLVDRGHEVAGLDISGEMLRRLLAKGSMPVVRGDATKLPFRNDSFGSAIAIRIFHLLPKWKVAADELVRVLRPGARILVCFGGFGGEWRDVMRSFADNAGVELHPDGLRDIGDLDAHMKNLGAARRELSTIIDRREITWNAVLSDLERGLYSWTWRISPDERRIAAERTRAWTEERFGSLSEPRVVDLDLPWVAYDMP